MSRIAIVNGIRTPFAKAWTDFWDMPAQELGRVAVRELLERTAIEPNLIDEVIFGAVANPPEAANMARVISLLSGIPKEKRAYTISRNCASGFEAVTSAVEKIQSGFDQIVIAGGAESMSNIPMYYPKETAKLFLRLSKAKNPFERVGILFSLLKPKYLLKPVIGLQLGLTDPVCGLNMGQTAEILAKEYGVTRKEQDEFALMSHRHASAAGEKLREEIVPVLVPPKYEKAVQDDNGARKNITIEDLAKLKPFFDRYSGSVTVGNACQVTDGACALLVMKEERARELGFQPLGFIRSYAYCGVEPSKMGIGPAFAIPEVLAKANLKLSDIELIEINEAFAAQVIACERHLAASNIGKLNREILNVNGGAIALGHPVGVTGSRLILTLLKELQRRNQHLGLASLCVGGGQGAAVIVER
ncbi:MAG TPA: acetyl-CoA C-acyltransferase, partial [Candidatus Omnitrophica bacterium]|nr:acetyl-CoA C-acyltransferase [Candidatus Omnitrophota bacterium]